MSFRVKTLLCAVMTAGLAAGFFHHVRPSMGADFGRLHIFLFNLVAGGSSLLYFARGKNSPGPTVAAYFLVALAFSFFAFKGWHDLSVIACLGLFALVESVRIRRFTFFPFEFFRPEGDTALKFLHAALLCLSIGLLLCSLAILDHSRLHLFNSPKFGLETFFLGFSFPISLVSFYAIFRLVPKAEGPSETIAHNAAFWLLNLGVIIFFLFILAGSVWGQAFASFTLYFAVLLVFKILCQRGEKGQPRIILLSGLCFLLGAALTGIAYIIIEMAIGTGLSDRFLMRFHAFLALYGWNLSGIIALARKDDFPINIRSPRIVAHHWLVVAVLAPLGYGNPLAAMLAVAFFALFLGIVLFAANSGDQRSLK